MPSLKQCLGLAAMQHGERHEGVSLCNKHHKITYKVNVKMRLDAISLQATLILGYARCELPDVASIAVIASSKLFNVENIELFRRCHWWWHECCWTLTNGHWIRRGGWNNYCFVWIPRSSSNTTLYTAGLSYEHRHVKFSSLSKAFSTDTVQRWWLYWL